jgi:hypothetical protein
LEALETGEEERARVTDVACRRMRLLSVGRRHWLG